MYCIDSYIRISRKDPQIDDPSGKWGFKAESAKTAMLHLLGLFDRPVPLDALRALVAEPVIAGLTEPFHVADAPPLALVLSRLEELKLITRPPDTETVDGHPLVREHFGAELEAKSPETWKQAHGRLFDYFCDIPDQDQPDDEAGLMPLYQSLHHGVAAGRAQETLDNIHYRRISREGQAYGVKKLGLFSTELAAIAGFFSGGWQNPVQEVTRADQGFLLNLAGFRLRALGQLKEAQTPFERGIVLAIERDNHFNAARGSNTLSELLLIRGELQAALGRANAAVDLIDRTGQNFWQLMFRTHLAYVQAMQGKMREAGALFEKAEERLIQEEPNSSYLSSASGFFYSSFLLRSALHSALPSLAVRVQATLKIAEANGWLIDIGRDSLNLARIAALAGDETAAAQFDAAIAALRMAGSRHHVPRGYLARAEFRRSQGDLAGVREDLDQTRHIAEPSGMRLHLCDALIEEAWLHHLSGDNDKARGAFKKAEAEVNDMGYHWQDSELDKLRAALD